MAASETGVPPSYQANCDNLWQNPGFLEKSVYNRRKSALGLIAPMKAREVLSRYATGERDFRRANLRGQSFKGQDLAGADFSEADIRGANFTHAVLRGANFTKAQAGVQKRWWGVQQGLAFLMSALAGILSAFGGANIANFFRNNGSNISAHSITGIIVVGLIIVTLAAIFRYGFTAKIINAIVIIGICTVICTGLGTFAVSGAFIFTGAGAGAFVGAFAFTCLGASMFALTFASESALAIAGIFVFYSIFAGTSTSAVSFTSVSICFLSGVYCSYRALSGHENFAIIRSFGVAFQSTGGTSFCGADLTQVNFSQAQLKSTNFNDTKQQPTILAWVCWQDAQKLDFARVGTSMLANPAVRDLLVSRNGYKKSYIDANLRAANLNGVNLEQADLTWADLSDAHLRQANLKATNFTESLVLNTDFTGAHLTSACLEAWNIDSHTNLDQVDCQHVYLLRHQQERRPSSGDFAPGEFTKLFQEVLSTVDLIFRNGIDWKAFTYSFNQLVLDNAGTELSIQSIENKGDGVVVVRVNAPPDADKAQLHGAFNQTYAATVQALEAKYQAELQAKQDQITIYRQQSADMLEITRLMANRPINVPIHVQTTAEAKAMNESTDSSRKIEIGNISGDFNASGQALNLGDISGTVTNTINQLPDDPDPTQPNLKELLTQLQAAIADDTSLPEADKADLLEQVQNLATAKQTEEPAQKEGLVRKAKKMFEATLQGLPDTAKIAEACSKLLPLILKALGWPV
jgi:uncharacterized protein YjbI with pentapeptide repeats